MILIWKTIKEHFVRYLYVFLDKVGLSKKNAYILMFHHVTDKQVDSSPLCRCSVTHFVKVLEYLRTHSVRVVSINEALDNIKKGLLKDYVVITFDDAVESTFEVAYPILKSFNFPFTVYVTLDYLNRDGFINSEQLKTLNREPLCTIGSHTLTHPVLITALDAAEEIIHSKAELEKILNKEVLHFAYPYGGPGAVSFKNIFDAKSAGYSSAVSSVGCKLNYFSVLNRFFLPRVNGSFFKFYSMVNLTGTLAYIQFLV